jgi:hypothetical protein
MAGKTRRVVKDPTTGADMIIGIDHSECERLVRIFIERVAQDIVESYDWDFKHANTTNATVVGQANYTLTGLNDDAYDIINIRFDDTDTVLDQLNTLETDRRAGDKSQSGIYGWNQYERDDQGFPIVTFVNTPDEVRSFTYRYRRRFSSNQLDSRFDNVVREGVMAEFTPELSIIYKESLNTLIDAYKVGGDEYETVRMDPNIEAGNIRRGELQGGA